MSPTLTCRELDARDCDNPGCTHPHPDVLHLSPICHPDAGLQIEYNRLAGILIIGCAECRALVAKVQVAWGPDGGKS
jgi:hypothetical protein